MHSYKKPRLERMGQGHKSVQMPEDEAHEATH